MRGRRASLSAKSRDFLTDEIILILLESKIIEFSDLFGKVVDVLKQKHHHVGGEEILRLRIYEKLQSIVSSGGARKKGKTYEVLPKLEVLDSMSIPALRI